MENYKLYNISMKKSVLLLLVLFVQNVFGQDTIYKRVGGSYAAKIFEINETSVKYNRWDNLTGPVYIENKSDIARIKYANGHIDTFKVGATTVKPITVAPMVVQTVPTKVPGYYPLEKYGRAYLNNGSRVSRARALQIMSYYAREKGDGAINNEIKKVKLNQGFYTGTSIAAIPCLVVGALITSVGLVLNDIGEPNDALTYGIPILSAGFAFEIASIVTFAQRNSHTKKALNLYNQRVKP